MLDFVFKELEKFIGNSNFQKSEFIKLITLMFILHDYGKLNRKWQSPMQHYQALKEGLSKKDFKGILGHTDYDPNNIEDEELAQIAKLYSRPSHAGVGAFVSQEILPDMYNNDYLISGISTAIARHHSPLLSNFTDFNISDTNYGAIQKLLDEFDLDIELDREEYEDNLSGFEYDDWEKEQILYLFFVRILRRCDQKATEDYQRYFKEKNYV